MKALSKKIIALILVVAFVTPLIPSQLIHAGITTTCEVEQGRLELLAQGNPF